MAKSRQLEDQLHALSMLLRDAATPEARELIAGALRSRISLLVVKGAQAAGRSQSEEWMPALTEAFARFLRDPVRTDKGCQAKIEIVKALRALSCFDADVFLAGIRHVQMEGSYGPPVDTAAELRAQCAMALVEMNYPEAMLELVPLLVDEWTPARAGAARSLGASGNPAAEPLLRLKTLTGDAEIEVMAECFAALMAIAPERSVEFVARYLRSPDSERAEGAAMALSESRREAAFEALRDFWLSFGNREIRGTLLVAIATMRMESAFDFLIGIVEKSKGRGSDAQSALAALAVYRDDEKIQGRVDRALRSGAGESPAETLPE